MIMDDKAYISVRHCLCQEKRDDIDEEFDVEFRRIRNSVERFFAFLDQHKIFHYNQHRVEFVRLVFGLTCNAECIRWKIDETKYYHDTIEKIPLDHSVVQEWKSRPMCHCTFHRYDMEDAANTGEYRGIFACSQEDWGHPLWEVLRPWKKIRRHNKLTRSELKSKAASQKAAHAGLKKGRIIERSATEAN